MPNSSRQKNGLSNVPPCQAGCPIHQDVREYLRLIAVGDFNRSLEAIRRNNPLASVCGTICPHYCEDECRRQIIDEPLSIRGLKRAAAEYGEAPFHAPAADPRKKVAVIGSGPAGLLAAFDLAMQGINVTVFERETLVGGTPRNYIPLYRLPDEAIDRDIEALQKIGIEFKTGIELGTDFNLEDLKKDGFKAVVLAVGLTAGLSLPIPGAEHKDVLKSLQFLKASKREGFRLDGREVIVIGGGNVAMDVARSAVRCGAAKVRLVCLEAEGKMPAFSWEIEEAREEGVEFNCSWGPVGIRIRDGKIAGLEVRECISVFDGRNMFNPRFNEQKRGFIPGDTVIFSIGQALDPETVRRAGVPVDSSSRLEFNPVTMETSVQGVFACGEMVTGAGTAVKAMASGRKAALAVAAYLEGKSYSCSAGGTPDFLPLPSLEADVATNVKKIPRQKIPVLSPGERRADFSPVEKGYTMAMAVHESLRCLGCAGGARQIVEKCVNCLTCLRTCPYNVPVIDEAGKLLIREHQCQACGLCLTVCPNLAIEFRGLNFSEAEEKLEREIRAMPASANRRAPSILLLTCGLGDFALPGFNEGFIKNKPENAAVVKFPCISKIDTIHILEAFKLGVDGVIMAGCARENNLCPFQKTMSWAGQRAKRVRYLLDEAGIEEGRFAFIRLSPEEIARFGGGIGEVLSKMQELGKR
ncbi:MAG: FAD-dependent oxidoreductase [Firmicutes bacterium]|nr:FAD-dependent oxidoreductase [Bacillota bacterium]